MANKFVKLKYLTSLRDSYPIGDGDHGQIKPSDYLESGIPYIRVQNLSFNNKFIKEGLVYISEKVNKKNRKSILKPGDILIAKTGATIGKCVVLDENIPVANTTSSVGKITLDPNKINIRYAYYWIASKALQDEMWEIAGTKSAQPGFNIEDIKDFQILLCDTAKQKQIADYLDLKTSAIDGMIEDEEKAILEFAALKQTLIHESLSQVKKTIKVKHIAKITTGSTPKSNVSAYWSEEKDVVWITPADMKDDMVYIDSGDRFITKRGYNSCGTTFVDKNSLIISTRAPIGKAVINNVRCCFNQGCKALTFKEGFNSKFYYYWLIANSQELVNLGRGTTFLELSTKDLSDICVPLCNENIQKKIVSFLDKKIGSIDQLVQLKKHKIELLKKYRESLLYETVTCRKEVKCNA